ncbi:spermidine synthase [Aquimarina brevivitae]|uniref:Spermine/spermidine synthase n=1 Tax=Aquimarina brevivitae TaxID=323412 RepID=A0A4Q7NTS0_9FLAO|nr:fused MFS/spermidine synthase [Aquimarina brevivitae]RZS90583.1 spermine/spermidine synthase [Aquimarina brevivitae]
MKKLASYIIPFTKTISSKISGTLEITWINGKKVLDSQNANYSYGSLQRVLEYGISKIYFDSKSDILVLGLGAGSVLHSLRKKFKHQGSITAVELDPVAIDLAKHEFEVDSLDNITIIESDAFDYVAHSKNTYHFIIVDLFIDDQVPESFYSQEFWDHIISILKPKGTVLFNAGIQLKNHQKLEQLIALYTDTMVFNIHNEVLGTNTLVIGRKQ